MDMGMTDNQWKDNLRSQLENWEDVRELVEPLAKKGEESAQKAMAKIDRNINRIKQGLED